MLEGLDGFQRVKFGHRATCATMAIEKWSLTDLVQSFLRTQIGADVRRRRLGRFAPFTSCVAEAGRRR
jgi:hypothetical protein